MSHHTPTKTYFELSQANWTVRNEGQYSRAHFCQSDLLGIVQKTVFVGGRRLCQTRTFPIREIRITTNDISSITLWWCLMKYVFIWRWRWEARWLMQTTRRQDKTTRMGHVVSTYCYCFCNINFKRLGINGVTVGCFVFKLGSLDINYN